MPTHDQQTTNFWFGESAVYTIFKAKAWRGATADNFPVVLLFKKKRLIKRRSYVIIVIAFVPVRAYSLKFGEKITFYHFSKKMPIQRFSPY